ncbi:MAG TPA: hypothetical protein VNY33_00040, partial [Gaiellaceae bacterium]|nr:hypothetical protein [Gaiellaceae bacterium]
MLGFLIAGAALALTAFVVASTLRVPSPGPFVVAWWVLVCAEVVAAGEVLSLAHALRPLGYGLFEVGVLLLALGAWQFTGRPLPAL